MFFIMGISTKEKKLEYVQSILCSRCELFGRLEVFMTYTYLSLFFIPIVKWNKKFFVTTSCCNTLYNLDKAVGTKILKKESVTINESDMQPLQSEGNYSKQYRCNQCGYVAEPEFTFCPKCGSRL
jgi:hypothetical protein